VGAKDNVPLPYPGFSGTLAQALRPYPYYQYISEPNQNIGNSNYNAFQLKVQRRFSHGLSVLAAYTMSKELTDSESSLGIFNGGSQDTYNRKLEKGPADGVDTPQYVTISYVYELPVGKGKELLNHGGVASAILGGWGTSGIWQDYSGFAAKFSGGASLPLFGGGVRPDRLAGADPYTGIGCHPATPFGTGAQPYYNIAAFSEPASYHFGTAARVQGNVRNCPTYNENMSLFRTFQIHEATKLVFRWEAFNVFNRTRFSGIGNNISNSSFGLFSGQGNQPRIMQFSLQLNF
jgi:hypothetical protein